MDFERIAKENRILEIRVGSHLFGTTTLDSDLDLLGMFMPSEAMVFGDVRCNEVDLSVKAKDDTGRNTADAVDRKLHEYRKFIILAMQNNPNILNALFVDDKNIVFENDYGRNLLDNAHLFPHKGAHHRFVGYADAQRHKMRIKPEHYAKLEKGLEVLEAADDNKVMAELKETKPFTYQGQGKHIKLGDLNFEAGVYVKTARKKVQARIDRATSRVVLFTKHGYDTKYGSNLIQLLKEGIELMETGRVVMPLAYRQDVLDIKAGKYSAEDLMQWADDLVEEARRAYEKSELPKNPRTDEIRAFMIQEVKRFVLQETRGIK